MQLRPADVQFLHDAVPFGMHLTLRLWQASHALFVGTDVAAVVVGEDVSDDITLWLGVEDFEELVVDDDETTMDNMVKHCPSAVCLILSPAVSCQPHLRRQETHRVRLSRNYKSVCVDNTAHAWFESRMSWLTPFCAEQTHTQFC